MEEEFHNPLIRSIETSPDPYIVKYGDYYYYCLSRLNGAIWVWRSATLGGLDATADKKVIWQAPAEGPFSKEVWAPELHFFEGRWYIYFAADNGENENHRMYVLQSDTDDVFGSYG